MKYVTIEVRCPRTNGATEPPRTVHVEDGDYLVRFGYKFWIGKSVYVPQQSGRVTSYEWIEADYQWAVRVEVKSEGP